MIVHKDLDEIVAKCPIIEDVSEKSKTSSASSIYDLIFYETQLAKMNCNPEFVTEIKEELIEFNAERNLITRYCVIIERAANTMADLRKIWTDDVRADQL